MRLFVAINPPSSTIDGLVGLQDDLRARALRGNFSLRDNLHMTLAFLGECDAAAAAAALGAVKAAQFERFTMVVDRVGCDRHHGRELWWAGVADCRELMTLQRSVAHELDARGCEFDRRVFRPHITLAREVGADTMPWLFEEFSWPVSQVDLMKSERIDGRLTYTPVNGF